MQDINKLLMDVLYHKGISDDISLRILKSFPTYIPDKSRGFILVDDAIAAEEVLKEHVGESEFDGYYPKEKVSPFTLLNLIQEKNESNPNGTSIYLGKFDLEKPELFFEKLYIQGIRIFNFEFIAPSAYY